MTVQHTDHSRWLVVQVVQKLAVRACCRVGNRNAAKCQVFGQLQVKRQLLGRQAFKQGQHKASLVGIYEVIGVFNAAAAGLDGLQCPQIQGLQKVSSLVKRDFCIDSHASDQYVRQNLKLQHVPDTRTGCVALGS